MIFNNGIYNGVITGIELKEYTKKDNKTKFEVFKVAVRVNGDKQGLKDLKATFSKEYGLKYFRDFCKISSKELIGKDWFMTFPDFDVYVKTREQAYADYENRHDWAKKMLVNIAKAGYFSSDRTIEEYNRDIWKLEQ